MDRIQFDPTLCQLASATLFGRYVLWTWFTWAIPWKRAIS